MEWKARPIRDAHVIASRLNRSVRFVHKIIKPLKDAEKGEREIRIRALAEAGYTEEQIAEEMGITQQTVSFIINSLPINERRSFFCKPENTHNSTNLSDHPKEAGVYSSEVMSTGGNVPPENSKPAENTQETSEKAAEA